MFSLGGAGLMVISAILMVAHFFHFLSQKVLDQTHNPSTPKINRIMLQVQNRKIQNATQKKFFSARGVRVHGSELCLLLHLHEDENARLHEIVNLQPETGSFAPHPKILLSLSVIC